MQEWILPGTGGYNNQSIDSHACALNLTSLQMHTCIFRLFVCFDLWVVELLWS